MNEEDKIKKALLKKALGYNASEVVEEYSLNEEGDLKLSKKKVTKKHYGSDVSAVKILLERYYKTYEERVLAMSDEMLSEEKARLEATIKKGGKNGD